MESITVEGGKGAVELQADGVLHVTWKPNVRIGAQDARAAMAVVNEIADGSECPMLVEMATVEAVSRLARAVFSIPSAASRIAFLGSGPVDRVLAKLCSKSSFSALKLPCPGTPSHVHDQKN